MCSITGKNTKKSWYFYRRFCQIDSECQKFCTGTGSNCRLYGKCTLSSSTETNPNETIEIYRNQPIVVRVGRKNKRKIDTMYILLKFFAKNFNESYHK